MQLCLTISVRLYIICIHLRKRERKKANKKEWKSKEQQKKSTRRTALNMLSFLLYRSKK